MRSARANRILVTAGVLLVTLLGVGPIVSGQGPAQVTIATVNNMNHVPQFVAVEKGMGSIPPRPRRRSPTWTFDPRFSADILRAQAVVDKVMIDRGRIKQGADLSKAIDTSYLDKVMRRPADVLRPQTGALEAAVHAKIHTG